MLAMIFMLLLLLPTLVWHDCMTTSLCFGGGSYLNSRENGWGRSCSTLRTDTQCNATHSKYPISQFYSCIHWKVPVCKCYVGNHSSVSRFGKWNGRQSCTFFSLLNRMQVSSSIYNPTFVVEAGHLYISIGGGQPQYSQSNSITASLFIQNSSSNCPIATAAQFVS